ncbi:MAG: DUF6686 family protein [Xanthomarina gelatinilytica]|uniref:DUF6686 family protein n=1 Tax=Xanthomarina gelatinilytica TaxID=1137281 RepID=UPI003A836D3C
MNHSLKTLSKVNSGALSVCLDCNIYHLEFNNLYFEFNTKQFKHFKTYVLSVDCMFWECKYAKTCFKRKIPIPSMQDNLILMFNRQEIEELKSLMLQQKTLRLLDVDAIDYKLILN